MSGLGSAGRSSNLELLLRIIITASVFFTLTIAAALLYFTHPMGDDLCNVVSVRDTNVLGAAWRYYTHWGGRWASQIVVLGLPAAFDVTRWYPLLLLGYLAVQTVCLRFLLGSLQLPGNGRLLWWLTAAGSALYWAGMPHPGQTVYWLEGAGTYSLCASLSLLLIGCLLRLPRSPTRRSRWASVGLAAACMLVASFHELVALMLGGTLATGVCVALMVRDSRWRAWTGALLGTVIGFATVVLAPGNEMREAATLAHERSVTRALAAALQMWLRILDVPVSRGDGMGQHSPLGWILDPKLLAATVLLVTSARLTSLRPPWMDRTGPALRLIAPLACLAILVGALVAGGWATSRALPLRAMNSVYVAFLLGWFLSVWLYAASEVRLEVRHPMVRVLRSVAGLVFALGLLFSTNAKYAVRDLVTGRAIAFDREMTQRYEEAPTVRAAGEVELVVRHVEPWPSSYFDNDIGALEKPCAEQFFLVQAIRFDGPNRDRAGEP